MPGDRQAAVEGVVTVLAYQVSDLGDVVQATQTEWWHGRQDAWKHGRDTAKGIADQFKINIDLGGNSSSRIRFLFGTDPGYEVKSRLLYSWSGALRAAYCAEYKLLIPLHLKLPETTATATQDAELERLCVALAKAETEIKAKDATIQLMTTERDAVLRCFAELPANFKSRIKGHELPDGPRRVHDRPTPTRVG
jgi:hypothetical protein